MKQVREWHQTKRGLVAFFLLELVLMYAFASLSIARGNLWYYLLTLVFIVGSLQNLFMLFGKVVRRHA
jgi:hypothetical protein